MSEFSRDFSRDWMVDAACRELPPEAWFPERGHKGRRSGPEQLSENDEQMAKRVCRGCPVRLDCRAYATATGSYYGIWGANTENERAKQEGRYLRRAYQPKPKAV